MKLCEALIKGGRVTSHMNVVYLEVLVILEHHDNILFTLHTLPSGSVVVLDS